MKKRILSCLMALALCLTLLPTAALAEETEGTAQTSPAMEEAADPANGEAKQENQPAAPEQEGQSAEAKQKSQSAEAKQENQPAEQEEQQEDSAAKQAVAAVQAMIDALPDAAELDGMDDAEAMEVYEAFQTACEAYYDTLSEKQQAQLKNTEKLAALSERFSQLETLAEEDTHTHFLCGGADCNGKGHKKEETATTFDKWLASSSSGKYALNVGGKGSSSETGGDGLNPVGGKYVLPDGSYYLKTGDGFDSDVTIEHPIQIKGDVTICLNGRTIQSTAEDQPVFEVVSGGKLTLTDCKSNQGKVTSAYRGGGVEVNGGTFNLYGGSITKNKAAKGGGVKVTSGTVNVYGGAIADNKAAGSAEGTGNGGGVYMSGGTFHMRGGSITDNTTEVYSNGEGNGGGVYVSGGTFNLYNGGSITNNKAINYVGQNRGGGVHVGSYDKAGTFNLYGGEISNNEAEDGGGVYVYDGTFTMRGGKITGNTATSLGGGVCVYNGTFTMSDGEISGNNEASSGGGVSVDIGTFNMSGGKITGNTATKYGGGVHMTSGTYGTLNVSGTAVIKDNQKGTDANNVHLFKDKFITVGGTLDGGASIGVTTEKTPAAGGTIPIATGTGLTPADAAKFQSDLGGYAVSVNEDKTGLVLVKAHTHCICGNSSCNEDGHGEAVTFATVLTQALLEQNRYTLSDGTYYLNGTLSPVNKIEITGTVTICLNGQTIQSTAADQSVFEIADGGKLTLTDCTSNPGTVTHSNVTGSGVEVKKGTFTMYGGEISGNSASNGGGVYVCGGSTFDLYGGKISGNTVTNDGGGVCVATNGKFNMHGGKIEISGNTAATYGGGVYVATTGEFNMRGGTIGGAAADKANKAKNGGGGVYVSGGTFNMSGGSITGNDSNGVFVWGNATFTVSGAATVKGNTREGAASNVFLTGSAKITIGGELTGSPNSIGVTRGAYLDIANNVNKDYSGIFFSDKTQYVVKYKDKQLVLAAKDTTAETHTHCLCGKTHTAIGDHKTEQEVTFATKLWMDNGVLKKGDNAWGKGTVKRADSGNDSSEGYVLTTGSYYLENDLTLSGAAILIGGDVKLCLNGHTIDRANGNAALDYVIKVLGKNAHLTLTDCMGGGTIKGGGNGGVDIFGFCTLDMFGGTITGNTNRGVDVGQFGEFNMYGGKITGNNARYGNGGGVYTYGKFTMSGGSITNNTAPEKGGGVFVDGGTFTVSGNVNITNNTAGGKTNNVYLSEGKTIAIGTGGLSGTIGVTTEPKPAAGTPVKVIASIGSNTGLTNHVVSDDNAYATAVEGSAIVLKVKGDGGETPAEKPNPQYSAPTPRARLTYTGEPQVLINGGSVEGGMMQYRLDNGAYSPDLPTATNAGIYTVYYKVVGDASHNDVAEQSLKVWIEKAKLSGTPTFTKVTEAGKTLKDVTFTKADGWPDGEFEWGNGVLGYLEDKPLVQGKAYSWLYLTDNFYAEGTVVLWADPSSSGGGSTGGNTGGSSSGGSDSNPIIKTETKNNADGSTTKTETRRDGSVTQTTTGKDGSVSKTETKPNGSSVTENKAADGSTGTVKTDKNGQTAAETKVSAKAVEDAKKSGEAVKAPVEVEASRNSSTAPTVKVELPKGAGETKVEIPVSNVKSGTVAVLVHPDGTEEILKNSIPTENGIQLTVDGNATVKIVDNSKGFIDTQDHWAEDAIDFVSARGLVNGMSATIYAPNNSTTRAQLWTILARQNDADLSGGSIWYEKAQNWAKDKGVSDGANPNAAINRAQMVTMLWRAEGQPAAGGAATFTDVSADSYYAQAVAWAIENGITTGVGGGKFDPAATCTRAQIAAFLARLYAEK